MDNSNKCIVCGCNVIPERVEFLKENNKEITCLEHGQHNKIKAIYSGEYGTSDLIFCDRIYNDSVRTKLYKIEDIEFDDEEFDDESNTDTENYE